jgi:hypothetical protein
MVSYQTKIPIWVNFGGPYIGNVTDIWDILCPFGTFLFIWHIFSGFGILFQEKSGNPGPLFHSRPPWYIEPMPDERPLFCFRRLNNPAGYIQGCQMVYFQTKNPNLGKF